MNNNEYGKFIKLLSSSNINSDKFNQKTSDIDIDDKISEYDIKLGLQEASINEQKEAQNEQKKELEKLSNNIDKTKSEMIWVKTLFIGFISLFLIVFLGWCIETFIRFDSVKQDYIKKTEELNTQIELFKKEIDDIKENNINFENNIDKEIEKEVELQLGRQIIHISKTNVSFQ